MPIRLVSRFKLDRVDFYGKQLFRQKTIAHSRRKHLEHVIESSYIDLIQWSANSNINMTDSMVVFVNANAVYGIANKGDVLSLLCESDEIVHGSLKRTLKYRINRNNRLNLMKNMEFKEEGTADIINAMKMGLKGNLTSSDCNSNNLSIPKENLLLASTDSMHECPDFLQDNSDYQWFLDYGYKENNFSHHQSILSIGRSQDLVYYDRMARNLDANLAEVDMDDFNREDIHSVLSSLPNVPGVEEREMFASVSGSIMVKFGLEESEEQSNCASMCKSQPLFSPVHESYMPNTNLSVDSLDLSENDINLMVTCQGNKHNYTIAFEGSTVMGADDSESRETGTSRGSDVQSTSDENEVSCSGDGFSKNQECVDHFRTETKSAMTCSDSPFTTWSKIKKNSNENLQLRRHPSGNNNTTDDASTSSRDGNIPQTVKSLSLPNLFRENQRSFTVKTGSNSASLEGEQHCIKLYDIQNTCNSRSVDHSTLGASGKPPHNFSLLKLFIKQKSGSHEGMSKYAKEEAVNDTQKNNMIGNNQATTKDSRMNEINKIKADQSSITLIDGNVNQKNYSQFKYELSNSNCGKHTTGISNEKIISKKCKGTDTQSKDEYDSGHENKYFSDESTQENGSNTESAENLVCNCAKDQSNKNFKKTVIEKSIQTSKLTVSNDSTRKSRLKVPVYILYPNYSLPDLDFLKKKHYVQNIDFSKVFVRPQKFQSTGSSQASSPKANATRPFSVNDIETLKKTGFKHVKDWESLTFLLPKEYKQFLQDIPEIVSQLKQVKNTKDELVPLFCLSPPVTRKMKKRPMSCDSNFFNNDYRSSNYSSTATQPSSGFRGSSTMLNSNNSSSTSSPRTPYGHKTDSSTDSSSWRKSGSFLHRRQYSRNSSEVPPLRPPLPRGILRNNSLDNQQYTCKTQKENANKRYSMIELTDRNAAVDDKHLRRRSGPTFAPQGTKYDRQPSRETACKKVSKGDCTVDSEENSRFFEEPSRIQNDLKRLEELLEISAAFGENMESFTENDMMKLRSQVSRFLTMHKNLEKVSETLQTVDEGGGTEISGHKSSNIKEDSSSLDVKCSNTPHNTPERKQQVKGGCEKDLNLKGIPTRRTSDAYECHSFTDDMDENFYTDDTLGGLKKTVSFAERICFAVKEQELMASDANKNFGQGELRRGVTLAISEESLESSLAESLTRNQLYSSTDLLRKRELVLDVKNAVEKVLKFWKESQEDPTNLCLHHLCPSLYAILSDGLKEEIETPFGPIRNAVWNVIEGSSQSGPMTQTLNELVQRLNRDDVFTEGLIKFNAFIFGLINARALSGWFSYLRTRDSLLRKYYDNSGLLLMSNIGGAPIRILVDQLINILESLNSVRFNLDLLYQTKLLHCSLQNINHLLEGADSNAFLTPTKQFMLMKLVQSIQNSISQSGEGKKSKQLLEDLDAKTSDPPVANLLEGNKEVRHRRTNKARPRSGCDIIGKDKDIQDVTAAMQKRWSGVHTNSKLVEAFDKLGNDSESDYTDSLDIKPPRNEKFSSPKSVGKRLILVSASTKGLGTNSNMPPEHNTKEQKKNILHNLNKKGFKTDTKTELGSGEASGDASSPSQNGGHKFKRLQQKWEKLTGRTDSKNPSERKLRHRPNTAPDKCQTFEKFYCDINNCNLPSPTSRISKIPRLVTSPSSNPPSIKGSKKIVSPTTHNSTSSNLKASRSLAFSKNQSSESKVTPVSGRLSRCDNKSEGLATAAEKSHITRPTSLPYRELGSTPTSKSEAIARRASSASTHRKATPKKLHSGQRTVRTLTHRLPSDSGHLSFNEGEKLKVVLEVDKTWLLCCRGSQKGLVPKSAVISDLEGSKF
ncbi:hypothetical protein RUM43_000598 [Polyplax serrata]|uniref:Iporin n=1 Tax=Polyplax serrata TaxID=468196 RepID=A0AAN8SE62_POLSC